MCVGNARRETIIVCFITIKCAIYPNIYIYICVYVIKKEHLIRCCICLLCEWLEEIAICDGIALEIKKIVGKQAKLV